MSCLGKATVSFLSRGPYCRSEYWKLELYLRYDTVRILCCVHANNLDIYIAVRLAIQK